MNFRFSRIIGAVMFILLAGLTACQPVPVATPTPPLPTGVTATPQPSFLSGTPTPIIPAASPTGTRSTNPAATAGTSSSPTVASETGTPVTTATTSQATPATTPTAISATPTTVSGGTNPVTQTTAATFPITVTDDANRSVTIKSAPNKIVSLAPSNTEILYALNLGPRIVAVSQVDNYPEDVKNKPKIATNQLKPNIEQVVATGADLVLMIGGDADSVKQIADKNIPVIVLDPKDIAGIYKDINMVGQVSGQTSQAKALVDTMQAKIDAITAKTKGLSDKPKVFAELDASDPTKPFTVGPNTFIDTLITMAGGQNIESDAKIQYPQVSLEDIVAKNPDIIILTDANYGATPDQVAKRPGWSGINAVKNNKVLPINDDLISRPGPRIVDGLEQLAKIIHPEIFK